MISLTLILMQILSIESMENKSKLGLFIIAAEITVTASSAECLLSSVASLSEDATSTNNRETTSNLTKSVIVVGCIGALVICLHLILCLRENSCRSSDQMIP